MDPAPSRHTNSRRWPVRTAVALAFLSLFAVTAWNLTHSTALEEGASAYARGDLPLALERALTHLSRQPWNSQAAVLAANCLSRLDYSEEAEPYYARVRGMSLGDRQIRAYGLARGPHPERAVPVYHEILARWPENVTALRRLGAVLLALEKTDELEAVANRLIAIPSGVVLGQTLRSAVFHNQQNHEQAVAACEKVLELDPDLRQIPLPRRLFWMQFTDDLIGSGRIADARDRLRTYLATTQDAELMDRLGRIYLLLEGSLDDAQRCFMQATEWDPNEFAPHLDLAKLALQRHDPELALKHLSQANLLAPGEYSVLYSLESVYRQLGQTALADRVQDDLKRLRRDSARTRKHEPWLPHEL
jgi:tetratricopeptide (TPR) repeat protein